MEYAGGLKTGLYEQMNLFDERDPLSMVCEFFKDAYQHRAEWYKKQGGSQYPKTFSEFVLDCFSGYTGGTAPQAFRDQGWTQYGCTAKGLELRKREGSEWVSLLVKKEYILKAFGIKAEQEEQK